MNVLLTLALLVPGPSGDPQAEVGVYGATPAGVIAAVAAAREGRTVLLIDPGRHVGGMVSGGLGATDHGNRAAIGGYSREFFDRIREHYVKAYGAGSEQARDCSEGFKFEPHVALEVFREMLREARVEPILGQRIRAVRKEGARIASVTTASGDTFGASVWIDASYEGDLLALAGVTCVWGREARSEFGEALAGVQAHSPAHQWAAKVPGRDAEGRLLPSVGLQPLAPPGTGDQKLQAFNFRLCMTDRPDNLIPWPRPAHYDAGRYELLARYLRMKPALRVAQLMNPVRMPNGKTDTNNNGPFSTDHIGANWGYVEADDDGRAAIWADHLEYTEGFFWFLAHDPRVPEALHDEINRWGLAADEFAQTRHWPPQLYVREARRMRGEYVMTEKDIMTDRTKPDAVGMGSYNADSHHCQRVLLEDATVLNEGDFQVHVSPYAIPYRCLLPRAAQCENLLAAVCVSASHVAYGTLRMEPVYMILGQACGVAASMAVGARTSVQKVDAEALGARLRAQKAVLTLGGPSGGARPAGEGVVVDDAQASTTGEWVHSTASPGFVGDGYLHDNNQDKGRKSVRFSATLPTAGRYEVFFYYCPNSNRATNVPVLIGDKRVSVNEREPLKEGKPLSLGIYDLPATPTVEVRTDGTDGYVVVDAVGFVKRP